MQEIFQGIFENHIIRVAFWSWVIAQCLKIPGDMITHNGKLDIKRVISSGGMPSSHSALVVAVATSIGRTSGWNSPLFAFAGVMAVIVMYDAAGVRRAAGKQAEIINLMIDDIYKGEKISENRLKELIGHSPFEVVMGAILGMVIGWFF